ncbi:ketosteroid isomerase-like protein [Streptomyces sp. V4I2]|nr:ketosteroid isomerase-like protein [Streptomyces sp. V4I2]
MRASPISRRHMDEGRPRFEADRNEREELAERFFDAFREGDVDGLRGLLAADVHMVGDGGGKASQWAKARIGVDNVAGCSSRSSRHWSGSASWWSRVR